MLYNFVPAALLGIARNLSRLLPQYTVSLRCPKKRNLCKKPETVTAGADATEYVRLLFTYGPKTVAPAPAVTGAVFLQSLRLFLGQCGDKIRIVILLEHFVKGPF